jgi:hypothetical protein
MIAKPQISALTPEDIRKVSPALENYTRADTEGGLWKRPGLSARDRSIVTVSALIARNQTIRMLHYLNTALDNSVEPVNFRRSLPIWRSTPAGQTPSPLFRLSKISLSSAGSAQTSFRLSRLSCCP